MLSLCSSFSAGNRALRSADRFEGTGGEATPHAETSIGAAVERAIVMPDKNIFDRYLLALRKTPLDEKTEYTDRAALQALLLIDP